MHFPSPTLGSTTARRWPVAVFVAALCLIAPPQGWAQSTPEVSPHGLPHLGDVEGMSIGAERRLGDQIARDIYRDPDYLDDVVLGDYLQSLWRPLLGAARARGDVPPELAERLAWELMISRDRRVNAFALPGGYLGVHLGLLAVTETPAELASVLAHELSHISQRHIARLVSRQDRQAPWMLGAMILAALAARNNSNLAGAAMAGGQAVAAQTQLNFSRDMEREADRVGFGVLTGAGFDGQGFVGMFDKLQQAARLNDDGSFPYLRSHPLTSERMADMRNRLPMATGAQNSVLRSTQAVQTPAANPAPNGAVNGPGRGLVLELRDAQRLGQVPLSALPSPELHLLMAARARVLADSSSERQRAWLQIGQMASASAADVYAAALAAQRLGQHAQALGLAQRLRAAATPSTQAAADRLLLEVSVVAIRSGFTVPGEALALLRNQALASTSRADVLLGAQAAVAMAVPRQASERLQAWVVAYPRDALAWQTLSSAYLAQGQRLRAVRAEAEVRAAQLDFAGAAERFKTAQGLSASERAMDPIELAIVDTRRREVEEQLRESAREAREN